MFILKLKVSSLYELVRLARSIKIAVMNDRAEILWGHCTATTSSVRSAHSTKSAIASSVATVAATGRVSVTTETENQFRISQKPC